MIFTATCKNDILEFGHLIPKGYSVSFNVQGYSWGWLDVKKAIDDDLNMNISMCWMHTGAWDVK